MAKVDFNNVVFELCPSCESEVKLKNKLEIQTCPLCNAEIKPCSMCIDCSNCPL